jgi:hypothetical protein
MPIELLQQIIERTLLEYGKTASYNDYQTVAWRMFPNEMQALAQSFTRQGFIKWLKDGMRRVENLDESDPDAPEVQLDLLPGLAAPSYLNIGSDVEPQLMRFVDATEPEIVTSIEKRRRVVRRISTRVEDLELKLEWLRAYRKSEADSFGVVCNRLRQSAGQPTAESEFALRP